MNILTVEGVAKSYGTRVLFDDVTFSIDGGQKLGLIGLNGAGKTTLLKIIAGLAEADTGEIWRNPKARIHYLPQEPQFQPGRSVLESVLDGDLPVMDVLRRYEAAVEEDDDEAVLKLTGEMDEKQAWELEQHAKWYSRNWGFPICPSPSIPCPAGSGSRAWGHDYQPDAGTGSLGIRQAV